MKMVHINIYKQIQWFSMCAKVEPSAYGAKHLWNSEKRGYGKATYTVVFYVRKGGAMRLWSQAPMEQ